MIRRPPNLPSQNRLTYMYNVHVAVHCVKIRMQESGDRFCLLQAFHTVHDTVQSRVFCSFRLLQCVWLDAERVECFRAIKGMDSIVLTWTCNYLTYQQSQVSDKHSPPSHNSRMMTTKYLQVFTPVHLHCTWDYAHRSMHHTANHNLSTKTCHSQHVHQIGEHLHTMLNILSNHATRTICTEIKLLWPYSGSGRKLSTNEREDLCLVVSQ